MLTDQTEIQKEEISTKSNVQKEEVDEILSEQISIEGLENDAIVKQIVPFIEGVIGGVTESKEKVTENYPHNSESSNQINFNEPFKDDFMILLKK